MRGGSSATSGANAAAHTIPANPIKKEALFTERAYLKGERRKKKTGRAQRAN
jgi:hypothetical protein